MRTFKTISILCILLATVACSTEEEVFNTIQTNKETTVADGDAFIAFNIQSEYTITKANSSDQEINNCSLILFNDAAGNSIYRAYDNLNVNENGFVSKDGQPFRIQVKLNAGTGKKLYAMVVANSDRSFAYCANLEEVQQTVQSDPGAYIKVNKNNQLAEVTITNDNLSTSISNATPVTAHITLQEISARIELVQFNIVEFREGAAIPVSIKNIALVNQVVETGTMTNDHINRSYNSDAVYHNGSAIALNYQSANNEPAQTDFSGISFTTFANTNEAKATALSFTLEYGGKEKEFSFVINRSGNLIESGNIYQITIHATLTNSAIDCDFVCYTADWNKVDLEEEEIVITL